MFAQRGDTELADKLQTQARQSQRIAQDWLGPEQSDRVITTVFKRDVAGYHAAGNQARGFEPIRAEIRACDAGLINGVR
jgi:hypothetical protein